MPRRVLVPLMLILLHVSLFAQLQDADELFDRATFLYERGDSDGLTTLS